ncbi:MAG: hypothetical protein K2I42_07270 [Anaeroplasmataceae bacterium]|nr:hypothetical protein [Anaeroplasmataceae bacterium]
MEEKEEGISLGEIIHVAFIKKWLLLGISVVVMLLGVILLVAIYNPGKQIYQMEFELRFPNYEEKIFPDGKEVIYSEFVSYENLAKAKQKSEDFSSIDTEKMVTKNDIQISEKEIVENNQTVRTGKYTIKVLKKYFSSDKQASKFLQTVANLPIDYVLETSSKIDYYYNLRQASTAGDYLSEIQSLNSQRELLLNGYDYLIDKYTNGYSIVLDGNDLTLNNAKLEIEAYFSKNKSLSSMKTEVEMNGYIKLDSNYLYEIERKKDELERESDLNKEKINALEKQIQAFYSQNTSGIVMDTALKSLFDEITTLTLRNAEIKYQIENVYNKYTDHSQVADYDTKVSNFDADLTKHYENLKKFTDTYDLFSKDIYDKNSYVVYSYGSHIVENGGINPLLGVVAFLILGFILGCCVNLVIDMPKYLKSKRKENNQILEMPLEETKE